MPTGSELGTIYQLLTSDPYVTKNKKESIIFVAVAKLHFLCTRKKQVWNGEMFQTLENVNINLYFGKPKN